MRQKAEALIYEDFIVRDPAAAAAFFSLQPTNQMSPIILVAISSYWGTHDLPACLDWIRTLPLLEDRRIARHTAIHGHARKYPKEVVHLLQKIGSSGNLVRDFGAEVELTAAK